jgi:hypothetical protein
MDGFVRTTEFFYGMVLCGPKNCEGEALWPGVGSGELRQEGRRNVDITGVQQLNIQAVDTITVPSYFSMVSMGFS